MDEARGEYQGGNRASRYKDVKNYWGDPEKAKAFAKRKLTMGEGGALYRRDCFECGAPLGFGITGEGKIIQLDLRAPVYCVTGEKKPQEDSGVVRTHMAFLSHAAICKGGA